MVVGWLLIALRFEGVASLKEKRHLLRRVLERLGREPNIAIAEVGDHDLWGNADIGITAVGNSVAHVQSVLQHAEDVVANDPRWEATVAAREIQSV